MSLFPAYENKILSETSSAAPELKVPENEPTTSWLSNSSFQPDVIPTLEALPKITVDSSDEEVREITPDDNKYPFVSLSSDGERNQTPPIKKSKKLAKRSKSHRKHRKGEPEYELYVKNVYYDDKIRDKGNLKVDTLCSRARPFYNVSQKPIGFVGYEWKQTEPLKRYHSKPTVPKSKAEKTDTIIKRSKSEIKETDDFNDEKLMAERNATQLKIKEYNQQLSEEPTNVELWIQYANLDDNNGFENSHNSSDIERMKYQRKLAIVEKALEANSDSKELLIAKLKFMSELVPADQYSQQIEALISKDAGNVVLWQALITATRSSVAMCTVPKIQSLYSKCFGTLHLWSKTTQQSYDNRLLNMLFQALIFLRHAGLWEQMSESIRLNLNLNLNLNSEDMNYWKESIDEKKLIDMEEVILTSKLPLNQLWLRVELLRENCHWLSVSRNKIEFIGDSHRFISPEDIAEYVHPLLTRGSNFKLAIYILVALKVPILPLRHNTVKYLEMDDMNWTVDSIEPLLSILYPCVGEIAGHKERLLLSRGLLEGGLTSGPQYLRFHPAQEPYLNFIRNTFHTIAENLKLENKISINIWWLRFERVLIAVQKEQSVHSDRGFKKLRAIVKEFLKKDENRNNLHYYREYALIEYEIGRFQNSVNILKMAIQTKGNILAAIHDDNERTALMSLYRTLIQLLLDERTRNESNGRDDLLIVFSQMSDGQSESECLIATEKYLHNCYMEFIENLHSLPMEDSMKKCFLPNFYCDTIACYIHLLYITKRPIAEIIQILDTCLEKTQETPYLQEQFYENKIIFLQLINEKNNNLRNCVNEAMKNHPDNCYVLSVLASIESELPYWSVSVHSKSHRLWPTLAMCLAGRARLHSSICLNDPAAMTAAINKLLHLHGKLSMAPDVRCCPLIWRLYMLLLRERNLCEKKGEEVYHASIAQCPWARCIYVDAAEIAPQFLTQIQDVIREKDLRMHVTFEELDILRG